MTRDDRFESSLSDVTLETTRGHSYDHTPIPDGKTEFCGFRRRLKMLKILMCFRKTNWLDQNVLWPAELNSVDCHTYPGVVVLVWFVTSSDGWGGSVCIFVGRFSSRPVEKSVSRRRRISRTIVTLYTVVRDTRGQSKGRKRRLIRVGETAKSETITRGGRNERKKEREEKNRKRNTI